MYRCRRGRARSAGRIRSRALLMPLVVMLGSGTASAQTPEARSLGGATRVEVGATDFEARFHALWSKREGPSQLEPTLKVLEAWIAAAPQAPEPLIKLSQVSYWYVYLLESGGTRERRLQILARGLEAGRKAASMAPSNPGGDFWAAVDLGAYGKLKGVTESVSSLSEIKQRLERVEKLDPNYFHGGVWRYYGRLIDSVPGALRMMFGYSLDDSLQFYQRALRAEPHYLLTWLWLAECHLLRKERAEAQRVLTEMLRRDPDGLPGAAPDNRLVQQRARALLKREFLDAGGG